jgi:hypothetical protein
VSAPDFYFAINATFRHLHDRYGQAALVAYWRALGHDYYRRRWENWRANGLPAVAADWREYFAREPQAEVEVTCTADVAELDVRVCPAIRHLRESGREIVPYFCEHCDEICGAMAQAAGLTFERTGGMGSCRQRFVRPTIRGEER